MTVRRCEGRLASGHRCRYVSVWGVPVRRDPDGLARLCEIHYRALLRAEARGERYRLARGHGAIATFTAAGA